MDSCVNVMICILLFRKVYSLQIQMFGIYLILCSIIETMLAQGYFFLHQFNNVACKMHISLNVS